MKQISTNVEKTILLIYPPYFRLLGEYRIWYPLGLGYLSSCLKSNGFKAIVYNADIESKFQERVISYKEKFYDSNKVITSVKDEKYYIWQEVRDVLLNTNPDAICISVLTETIPSVERIIKICRDFSENIPIILGGPHLKVDLKSLSNLQNWDYALIGEGEDGLIKLLQNHFISNNISKYQKGLIRRNNHGIDGDYNPLFYQKNLDSLPFPNLSDLYDFKKMTGNKIKKTMISTSRGCPFKCSFCYMNNYNEKMRFRTAKNVINEIKFNLNEFGIENFYFNDDSFGVNQKFLRDFSYLIKKENLQIRWSCMTHESLINPATLEMMKRSGCDSIHIGVESGSNRILKLLNKKTTTEKIYQKCRLINDFGIKIKAFFIFGIPSEEKNDLKGSIDLLEKINPYEAILQIYVPYPNTELWKYIEMKYGNQSKFYNWSEFYKSKINYSMFPKISPDEFNDIAKDFFSVVEEINKKNKVY